MAASSLVPHVAPLHYWRVACGPTNKSGGVRRPAKHASPEKRLCAGKATTPIGLASSLDRNYRRYVACERRVQYLQDAEHHGVLREDIVGEREELQKRSWTW
jgi:hypothetical protein